MSCYFKSLGDVDSFKERYVTLECLDEERYKAYLNIEAIEHHRKTYYDSKLQLKNLKENDLVLLYDSRF